MAKFFNVAGPCIPDEHYMVPVDTRSKDLERLVREKHFFVIHAPRQVGKTTLIRQFVRKLNQEGHYLALYCSLETVQGIEPLNESMPLILRALEMAVRFNPYAETKIDLASSLHEPGSALGELLINYCTAISKPLVIMFDEVDCLSGRALISFLRQLRQGYIGRGDIPFVHSLALVGMRNIRDYKAAVRGDEQTLGSASPFNIVTEALTLPNFTREEVAHLYNQNAEATGRVIADEVIDTVYAYTSGQPWLCNAVAREMVVKLLEDRTEPLTVDLVHLAVERIILRRDTHIDSLLERLKESRVRRVVEPVIMGEQVNLDFASDDAAYVFDLGLLVKNKGDVKPANAVYREVIIRALTYNSQYQLPTSLEGRFVKNGQLELSALLRAFQAFWRENSDIWVEKYDYKEAAPHLILQAFLQRILNGGGRIVREYSAGRGRYDLCIDLGHRRYALELKIQRRKNTREKGIQQLSRYLTTLSLNEGWLIIFNRDPAIGWDQKITWDKVTHEGKTIHVVGC